jgi:hypothetical protein
MVQSVGRTRSIWLRELIWLPGVGHGVARVGATRCGSGARGGLRPNIGAAESCQGLSVMTIGAIAFAEQLMTGHCDCPPEDASPAHASDTRGVQALREYHDKHGRATSDAARAPALAQRCRRGGVNMNYSAMADPAIPAGGFKASGYGRENAPGGPDDFLETQSFFLGPDLASQNCDAR